MKILELNTRRITVALVLAIGLLGCEVTEVRLEITTDALCVDIEGTVITTGTLETLDERPPTTSTPKCQAGRIGSLTIVPSGDDNAAFAVKVVTGLGFTPEECERNGFVGGCIVARRALNFVPERSIDLPIELEAVCIDVPCEATETCRDGRCVSATLDDPLACTDPLGCPPKRPDAGDADSSSTPESGGDAGDREVDASRADVGSGSTDAGTTDSGANDAAATDVDAGTTDSGANDAAATDADTTESGVPDSGTADSGVTDGSETDSGAVYGAEGPSCDGMTGTECQGESCCLSILVPGGTFPMGRSEDGTDAYAVSEPDEQPEHNATVDDFYMDAFEVTVGRFRRFVEQYDGTPPLDGAGAHPLIAGSGWQSSWNVNLPASQADLIGNITCSGKDQTWTNNPGSNETYPINCVSWYEAFAFCAWDGGRLPTEAEWEYASAGGNENRLYVWGAQDPEPSLANYYDSENSPKTEVGSHSAGQGRWGHRDLCGSLWEWVLDGYSDTWYTNGDCDNCAQLVDTSARVIRGASFINNLELLRVARRLSSIPTDSSTYKGIRCVRSP